MTNITNKLILFFLKWRVIVFIITLLILGWSGSIKSLANFDGLKFLKIAEMGYGTPETYYSYNLFPLYPTLVSFLSKYFSYLNSGLIISTICGLGSILAIYYLSKLETNSKKAEETTILLLLFPGAFYLNTTYSESLFLFLVLITMYFTRRGKFLPAVFFAALSSYTRAAGVLLWFFIFIEYFDQVKNWQSKIFSKQTFLLLVPPLGFISYLKYIEVNTSNFLNFLPSLPDRFVFLHQVFIRYFKMIIFVDHTSYLFIVVLTEIFLGSLSLFLLIFCFHKIRLSYWFYFLVVFFVPTLWGSFSGIGRFMLTCPPFFLSLSYWLDGNPKFKKPLYVVFGIFQLLNLIFFSKGLFVG